MKDDLGNRMKDIEIRFRSYLPKRSYTIIRIDGKAFHTYTRGMKRPFDYELVEDMKLTTLDLCKNIQGCRFGYTQSDEISLLLTDFDSITTDMWFNGAIQKIASVSASMATAYFNRHRVNRGLSLSTKLAMFDSRVFSMADPWDVFNVFLWRQKDAQRNAIQMIARSVASHKDCTNKNTSELLQLVSDRGIDIKTFPINCFNGTFVWKTEAAWTIDECTPNINQDRKKFFTNLPLYDINGIIDLVGE
jgi:tRNA(His) 5'-end guanylyltransferase